MLYLYCALRLSPSLSFPIFFAFVCVYVCVCWCVPNYAISIISLITNTQPHPVLPFFSYP